MFDDDKEELIIALRNEKGSYNCSLLKSAQRWIIALRNEKGSYNCFSLWTRTDFNYSTAK